MSFPNWRFIFRSLVLVMLWAALIVVGYHFSQTGLQDFHDTLSLIRDNPDYLTLAMCTLAYVLILALPFVPGLEIGILIMMLFGQMGVVVAYVATVGGLALSFAVARLLPSRVTSRWMIKCGLPDLTENPDCMFDKVLGEEQGRSKMMHKLCCLFLNNRHILLALSLNVPGNAALGGGGGIGFLCGISRSFGWRGYLTTILLATAPVPLLILFGLLQLDMIIKMDEYFYEFLMVLENLFW